MIAFQYAEPVVAARKASTDICVDGDSVDQKTGTTLKPFASTGPPLETTCGGAGNGAGNGTGCLPVSSTTPASSGTPESSGIIIIVPESAMDSEPPHAAAKIE